MGGVLYAVFGFHCVVVLDVASYLLSAALTVMIRHRGRAAETPPPASAGLGRFRAELRAGLGHVGRSTQLRILFGVAGLFFTGNAMLTALLVPYLGDVLHAGAQSLGVLFGTLGLGFILGGPASRLVTDRSRDRAVIAVSLVTADTSVTRRTPDHIQGRVGSVYLAVQGAGTLLGMIVGSVLGGRIGVVEAMDLAAALIAVSAAAALLLRAPVEQR